MICASCLANTLMGKFENSIVKGEPRDSVYFNCAIKNVMQKSNGGICSSCGRRLEYGESCYKENDVVEHSVNQVAKMLTSKVSCCTLCGIGVIYDDYSWSLRKSCEDEEEREKTEEELEYLNTAESIEDLFWHYFDNDCWCQLIPEIAKRMYCPNCGNGSGIDYDDKVDYGSFDQYSEIYTKKDERRFNKCFYGDECFDPDDELEKIVDSFTYDELRSITDDYLNDIVNSSGIRKLEKYIGSLFKDEFWYTLSKDRIIYRSRAKEKSKHYYDMWEPPAGMAYQGRYNEKGISVLYCSNCIDATKVEVTDKGYGFAIGKFLIKKEMLLFPVENVFLGNYAEFVISSGGPLTKKGKKSYLMTNLISAICRKNGYDGVVYSSVKRNEFTNYALFCKYDRGRELSCIGVFDE